jgi:hypothetical protein
MGIFKRMWCGLFHKRPRIATIPYYARDLVLNGKPIDPVFICHCAKCDTFYYWRLLDIPALQFKIEKDIALKSMEKYKDLNWGKI